jgi:putative intracellular protease/amidase/YHS domain-containing protein
MKRRELLQGAAAFGVMAAIGRGAKASPGAPGTSGATAGPAPLTPPAKGGVPVAFLISDGAVVIDFCGPWEVFHHANVPGRAEAPFELYTVAESTKPVRTGGGLMIVPSYTLENAPAPKVIVIPAQGGSSEAMLNWIRKSAKTADLTMSVCTGAFLLAKTGLLTGKAATTHHASYKSLAMQFSDIQVKRGMRYVEAGNVATAGGLSSGIDLALRVVERYYGRKAATETAYAMEYQGEGWLKPESNAVYAVARASTSGQPLCPVCEMEVDPATAPKSVYKGKTYYFCQPNHKTIFDEAPEKWQ